MAAASHAEVSPSAVVGSGALAAAESAAVMAFVALVALVAGYADHDPKEEVSEALLGSEGLLSTAGSSAVGFVVSCLQSPSPSWS